MAINIPAVSCITTKMASGNVQFVFQNPNSGVRYCLVMTSANVTAINTTVNGGSTGATLTQAYTQDQNNGDYPPMYVSS